MANVLISAMSSVDHALAASSPVLATLLNVTGSQLVTTSMMTGLFIISFSVNLANTASLSRLTWAWARDGGLPSYFTHVSSKYRVSTRAIVLTVFLLCALCLLNIGRSSYIAFGAITALSFLALYLSCAIAISSMLYARFGPNQVKMGEWNLGR